MPNAAIHAIVQRLESLQRAGVTHMPKRSRKMSADTPPSPPAPSPPSLPAQAAEPPHPPGSPPSSAGGKADLLEQVAEVVAECTRCPELAKTRTQTVFGVGSPEARLVFCGEAPGADEDRLGEPFVGRAGKLLDRILAACGLSRNDVYILNILRCRPPGNRTPNQDEAGNCREYLDAQLSIIQPEFICCLGSCAAQNLLDSKQSIGNMRGRFFEYRGARVLCTYHPSYLLRNPAAKRDVWDDMQLLMKEMGIEIPQR